MGAKIAIATVSGKAYYKLVKELKERSLPLISLIPGESIPSSIKVVITTEEEQHLIQHTNVLVYDSKTEPNGIISEAIRIAQEKKIYEEVTVGVDPGKTFGVAVVCDGSVLRTMEGLSLEGAIDMIISTLKENPAKVQTVRIGGGVPELAGEFSRRLTEALPKSVRIEVVNEEGTSRLKGKSGRRKLSDAESAVKISEKKERVF